MSPNRVHQRNHNTPSVIDSNSRRRRFFRLGATRILWFGTLFFTIAAHAAVNLKLGNAATGLTLTPAGGNYTAAFGNMNALGVGTPTAGLTVIRLSNGSLYYTPYQLTVTGGLAGTDSAYVTAYVTVNFVHTAALVLESCPSTSGCNASGNYSPMSTNLLAQTSIVPQPGMAKNTGTNAGIGIFLPDNNGASAYTGATDIAVITFTAFKNSDNTIIDTTTLTLNSNTVQEAVELQLATATSGLSVTPASDYSMDFGNVNALGIGPGVGLTTSAQAGGIIYSTPYNLLPAFSAFSSTTASIKVCVSTTFTHSTILQLEDSSTGSSGTFSNISTACGAATPLTGSVANRSTLTRYLGLFVSNVNGATAFTGTDTATLTYTLTVP